MSSCKENSASQRKETESHEMQLKMEETSHILQCLVILWNRSSVKCVSRRTACQKTSIDQWSIVVGISAEGDAEPSEETVRSWKEFIRRVDQDFYGH